MQTIRRTNARDQVSDQTKHYIVEQKRSPGNRLRTENQLAKTPGISRLSLREVTKTLAFLGIVESKIEEGVIVGRLHMTRVTKHLGFHAGLLDADPHELIDSRVIIETRVLPHVAR